MAEADRRAIAAGTPESVLVERAGRAVAAHAVRMLGGAYGRRVVVVCGQGQQRRRRSRCRDGAAHAWRRRRRVRPRRRRRRDRARARSRRADLAIDAMFGTGFRGALEGDAARVAQAFRRRVPTLAVDIPSGVDGATGEVRGDSVRAAETIVLRGTEARTAVRARSIPRREGARRRHRDRRRRAAAAV